MVQSHALPGQSVSGDPLPITHERVEEHRLILGVGHLNMAVNAVRNSPYMMLLVLSRGQELVAYYVAKHAFLPEVCCSPMWVPFPGKRMASIG
jgi:hypothetical protein